MLELKDNNNEYKVEEVKDKGVIKGKIYYLIKQARQLLKYNQQIDKDRIQRALVVIISYKKKKKGYKP